MVNVFCEHEPNKVCLIKSKQTSSSSPTTLRNSSRTGKCRCGTEFPCSLLISSVIPCNKRVERCQPKKSFVAVTINRKSVIIRRALSQFLHYELSRGIYFSSGYRLNPSLIKRIASASSLIMIVNNYQFDLCCWILHKILI